MIKIKDIQPWNGSRIVDFYVRCFNRRLIIVFEDLDNLNEIEELLETNYCDWCEYDKGECCEEYMLESLPLNYKSKIVCVMYEETEEEE